MFLVCFHWKLIFSKHIKTWQLFTVRLILGLVEKTEFSLKLDVKINVKTSHFRALRHWRRSKPVIFHISTSAVSASFYRYKNLACILKQKAAMRRFRSNAAFWRLSQKVTLLVKFDASQLHVETTHRKMMGGYESGMSWNLSILSVDWKFAKKIWVAFHLKNIYSQTCVKRP